VVVAYGKILPPAVLALPRHGCVNLHASLLPRYRGAAPLQYALMSGDDRTGLTVMRMDEGLDTGDILLQEPMTIGPKDDIRSLFARSAANGARLLLEAIALIEQGKAVYTPQDDALASTAPALTRESGLVDFASMNARMIDCRVRALCEWPTAYFQSGTSRVKIHRCEPVDADARPGVVLACDPLTIGCREGALVLASVTPEGRKTMTGAQYGVGLRLRAGDSFPS